MRGAVRWDAGSYDQLLDNDKVKQMVIEQLGAAGKSDKLKGFEFVKVRTRASRRWGARNARARLRREPALTGRATC